MKKYDIYTVESTYCVYIGRRKSGVHCFEPIMSQYTPITTTRGAELPLDYFPRYKPIVSRHYWGYRDILKEATLVEKRNGKKPTVKHILKLAEDYNEK